MYNKKEKELYTSTLCTIILVTKKIIETKHLTCGRLITFLSGISLKAHWACTYRPVHFCLTFCAFCTNVSEFTGIMTLRHVTCLCV